MILENAKEGKELKGRTQCPCQCCYRQSAEILEADMTLKAFLLYTSPIEANINFLFLNK
jgi:hypothetical protein